MRAWPAGTDPRSLRWKIALLVAAASCAVAAAVGVLVHQATYEWSLNEGRSSAVLALDRLEPGQFESYLPPQLLRELALRDPATWYDDDNPEQLWMWAATGAGGQVRAGRIEMGTDMRSLQALDRHIVMAALAALGVVVPLSVLAAELPNRRLRRVASTARRIAAGDLSARAGPAGRAGDEIAAISAAVDSMASALQARLLGEQRFTADVAHELRTPLMGLMTSTELLPPSEATEFVRDRVQVLRALVENLLEISRLDAGAEHAEHVPVPLGALVEESVRRGGLAARLETAGAGTVDTDPRRLDRIVANLVANAHRHGRPPVEVVVEGATVVVRDHGPGFPPELLAEGPQRFRTGTAERGRGHGLGLTIALGQARVIGADLSFGNAADGGAVATLRLPS